MPWLPDAVEGALIAGGVTLVGLLITNQSKISEFRQEWINALRDDVAQVVTHALEIHAAKTVEEVSDSFPRIQEATARIELRLNPAEGESKAVFAALANVRAAVHSDTTFADVNSRTDELIKATQVVLKKEWRRVKTGEPAYKWTFRTVAAALAASALVILYKKHDWLLQFVHVGR